jgi:hypothetical protein
VTKFTAIRCSLALALLLVLTPHGEGQYPILPIYRGYYLPPGYAGFGLGSVLSGQASVIRSSGQLMVNQEQARVQREKANQARIETKRKAFDDMMYRKANTRTFTQEQEKIAMMIVRRVMNRPLPAEVTTGKSQNILLPYLDRLRRQGLYGPAIALDGDMLKSINVTTDSDGASIGILKNGGDFDWPVALRGPTEQQLMPLFPKLITGALAGHVDLDLYATVNKGASRLLEELKQKFYKEEINGKAYLEGRHFLESLESSMKALRSPNAAKLLDGTYAATGRTVAELVHNMVTKGLRFAPATPGNEASYFALQGALVSFVVGAESNTISDSVILDSY